MAHKFKFGSVYFTTFTSAWDSKLILYTLLINQALGLYTENIAPLGSHSVDQVQWSMHKIVSMQGSEKYWLIRNYLRDWKHLEKMLQISLEITSSFRDVSHETTKKSSRLFLWDELGQCLVQYWENVGLAIQQSDWLIFVIGPSY